MERPAEMRFDYLRDKHRRLREANPTDLNLRTHRALSWLCRAGEVEEKDKDTAFILAWISFNAAYAHDLGEDHGAPARSSFQAFFEALVAHDPKGRIAHEIWHHYEGVISELLANRYIFGPFWKHHNGHPDYANWEIRFENARKAAQYAIERQDTPTMLSILFDRLYVLRNQLVHGGATWNSRVNRGQVGDGCALLLSLMPLFVDTMMSNPDHDWGAPHYPVIE